MFTGIIEKTAKVTKIAGSSKERVLIIENPFGMEISSGDSISVDGVCLTVETYSEKEIKFFVSEATVLKTLVSDYAPGTIVNLERAMRADGRFDGHIVQGHVDTSAVVKSVKRIEKGVEIRFGFDPGYSHYIADRGSVAVNGISLTCSEAGSDFFTVSLIPETLKRTSFATVPSVGRKVNIEFDIIGKYVAKILGKEKEKPNIQNLLEKL